MIWDGIVKIGELIVGGVKNNFENKQKLKQAIADNKIRLAESAQSHNQDWELRQLANVGWKDDVLFYAFIFMFIWAGFDPVGAAIFFTNLKILPPWFIKTWFWLVASVIGVKKIGDYLPSAIKGITDVVKKKNE
jgi:hypothetical protein